MAESALTAVAAVSSGLKNELAIRPAAARSLTPLLPLDLFAGALSSPAATEWAGCSPRGRACSGKDEAISKARGPCLAHRSSHNLLHF